MTLCIEAADEGEQQSVGGAVGDVEPAAQLVGQRMVNAQVELRLIIFFDNAISSAEIGARQDIHI